MALPTPEQVRALLAAVDSKFKPFVALCAFAGLRLGEATALRLADFDFDQGSIRVARQVQREGRGGVEIRAPKYGSERVVHVSDDLLALIEDYVAMHRSTGEPDSWLFEGESGNPPHQNTVGYWWRLTRKAAGCPTLRLHDLRHSFASGVIAEGCDVVTVQRALQRDCDTQHLRASVAERGGPNPARVCPVVYGRCGSL
ncbi:MULTISPECIES: tyrosine-type recombinase/integrase [Amycolatopsis]|uniref:Tyr recombinase domain-containing protein n=1 Tax=Amycolatopsis dongchuanensis TaxID=1070866 RepID=A0ABP9Q2C6_9PSEU|nr:site-specific integrase [Amycolatopsis sacchari]